MARMNYGKLEAAIHYICDRASQMGVELDPVKLNKVLWYADARMYLARGEPITGGRYIRKDYGPVAKYNRVALNKLKEAGAIKVGQVLTGHHVEERYDVLVAAPTNAFTADELQVLDETLDRLKPQTTKMVSNKTHGVIWQSVEDGEEIPLYAVYAEGARNPTPDMMALAAKDVA